jgi:hypothetical protein
MKIKEVLLPAITGTSLMTLFSYIAGEIEDENFNEADLLSKLYNRTSVDSGEEVSKVVGWSAHYLIGVMFAFVYAGIWQNMNLRPGIKHGLIAGGISGVAAIASWKIFFKMHPAPPGIKFNHYYAQLWVAHLVFAVVATLTYKFMKDRQAKNKTTKPI